MAREIATGAQDFEGIRLNHDFYVDKTDFIREWWNGRDAVTLITRPRRFGKTLNMTMLNCFFSNKYADRSDLFAGLKVWENQALREQQGKWPVLFVTFAGVKATSFRGAMAQIKKELSSIALGFGELRTSSLLEEEEKSSLRRLTDTMSDTDAAYALNLLSSLLHKHYGKKALIFLDEYDTPLQEAWVGGYWDQLVAFIRTIFNNTFKTNASLERALMTGITRVSKESIFSDLNNLEVVTTTSGKYATCFGFTEPEVFSAMDELGFSDADKKTVQRWYDGFSFGSISDMYNPWSITNYLDKRVIDAYWANSSSNSLVGKLLRAGKPEIKSLFEILMNGGDVTVPVDEQIIFSQLDASPSAVWSLLLASGYLKVVSAMSAVEAQERKSKRMYTLKLTNLEVHQMFEALIQGWFEQAGCLSDFVLAMQRGDVRSMTRYLNDIMLTSMSSFDGGKNPSVKTPENFYHGLVLGLLAENSAGYLVQSNRESGYGRYDVTMYPLKPEFPGIIMEFKVFDRLDDEAKMEDTAVNALRQIEERKYDTGLLARGIPASKILKYALAFHGKEVLIRKG